MSVFMKKGAFGRLALLLVLSLMLDCIFLYIFSFESYAEGGERPALSTESICTISHTHRGTAEAGGGCYTKPVYHVHQGDEEHGGECYATPVYHTHTAECDGICRATYISSVPAPNERAFCAVVSHQGYGDFYAYEVTLRHSACGMPDEVVHARGTCIRCQPELSIDAARSAAQYRHECKICGMNEGDIEKYVFSCDKTEDYIEHYELDCDLEEKEYGRLKLINSTPDWTDGNVTLTGVLEDPDGVIGDKGGAAMSFWHGNDRVGSSGTELTVSENGTYKLKADVNSDYFDVSPAEVMLEVGNIDRSAPVIREVTTGDGSMWFKSETLTVSAEDLQPDGTPGCGLADEAYSFDGGTTWQSSNSLEIRGNATVEVVVRDRLGHVSDATTVVIGNIDNELPNVTWSCTPEDWYEGEGDRVFTVSASDDGSGLAMEPFSYDGGITWTDSPTVTRRTAGSFTIMVRDSLGNVTVINVENSYSVKPEPPDTDDDDTGTDGNDDGGGPGGKDDQDGTGGRDDQSGTDGRDDQSGTDGRDDQSETDGRDDKDETGGGDSGKTSEGTDTADGKTDRDKSADKNRNKEKGKSGSGSSGSGENDADAGSTGNNEDSDKGEEAASQESSSTAANTSGLTGQKNAPASPADDMLKSKAKKVKKSGSSSSGGGEDDTEYDSKSSGSGDLSYDTYSDLWNWQVDSQNGYSIASADDMDGYTPVGYAAIDEYDDTVEISRADSDGKVSVISDRTSDDVPFYATRAFKVTASVGGVSFGLAVPVIVFLMMYSGVFVYSYDSARYRFMGIRMVRRSERGRYIRMGKDFLDGAYSSRFKLGLGLIYTRLHKDEMLHICAGDDWMSVPVQKSNYVTIKN